MMHLGELIISMYSKVKYHVFRPMAREMLYLDGLPRGRRGIRRTQEDPEDPRRIGQTQGGNA